MNNKTKKAVNAGGNFRWLGALAVIAMSCALLPASTAGKLVARNTPSFIATAKNLGTEDPAKVIEVSIWLQLHNRSQFDALTQSLYDHTSPNYRHWLTMKDFAARFAPTAQEAETVRQFFRAHNLKVVKTGPRNLYVRAQGTVGDVEKAFQVQLNNYQYRDKTVRANASDPYVEGPAGALVSAVSGLDTMEFENQLVTRSTNLKGANSAATAAPKPAGVTSPDFFSSQCFLPPVEETFSHNNNGSLPIGTYSGNKLNNASLNNIGCAYTPPEIQTAYNLTSLYKRGYNGGAQSIAIIDWCGSWTIQNDANAFSAQFGLPQLNSGQNFNIFYTAPSLCIGYEMLEINLDVEWAHAIAPGATINLVVPPSAYFQDVNQAEFDVLNNGWGNVISGSYGSIEEYTPASELAIENQLSEMAAALGVSAHFASGDMGDYTVYGFPPTVTAPADSPWSTAVGGVSLALNADNSIAWQSGWGSNFSILVYDAWVFDPPIRDAFQFGSGGGTSTCAFQDIYTNCLGGYPKPKFQSALSGKYRQLPDISWLADPYTGAAVLVTVPGLYPPQVWVSLGGTSLATPMFSGLWAIADEEAWSSTGQRLGQAAQYTYSMPAGSVFDIVPVHSTHNVTASLQESTGTNKYTASQVMGGAATSNFVSAIWDTWYWPYSALAVSFGTDCSMRANNYYPVCGTPQALHTKIGWDNVTGVGTPNAQAFADYFWGK